VDPGDVVADRFEVERLAGAGGMGAVYRAYDRHTGQPVAIKVLRLDRGSKDERFAREARLLAELSHPRIVRYIAHGETRAGQPYLVMEWLEGEDLAQRLVRTGLTLDETIRVVRRSAEALASAHSKALVHRDIKPSNLYLCEKDLDKLKLLDFGVARLVRMGPAITRTGVQIGTPGYMAPEQARGARQVDARADIFSLGCVFFHCLTGRRAFKGSDPVAVLAKVLFEEPPRPSDIRPDIPGALDDLVWRMLSKDPAGRPADGAAVVAEIDHLAELWGEISPTLTQSSPPSAAPPPASLTSGEQRLLSVVFARGAGFVPEQDDVGDVGDDAVTISSEVLRDQLKVRSMINSFGGQAESLADGSLVVTLSGTKAATDQAAIAARCALAIRAALSAADVALATGRGEVAGRLPVGEVIDRATGLLGTSGTDPIAPTQRPILVDDLTAGLLGSRFEINVGPNGRLELRAEHETMASRTLLGKPIPCMGRERELLTLQAIFDECVGEPVARAVVITGPVGIGKSRLRYEFLRKLAQGQRSVQVLMGRGDPMSAGSPFGLLGQAIRGALGLLDSDTLAARIQKLRARLATHFSEPDLTRTAEFLGEIAGTPFPDEESVQLRAARQDPTLMGDQTRRAWEEWLAAECAMNPVVIVLEDLHWGDLPTVTYVEHAMRALADRPLMVMALARPTLNDLFPKLWAERGAQPLPVGALTRRAAERLVKSALGEDVAPSTMALLVERAEGNAFYLEELIRSVASGRDDLLPATVVAMVQARLEGLEGEARRVLRAASIFGQVFWRGGVAALLGGEHKTSELDEWLAELVAREVIGQRPASKFAGDVEYTFRHTLVVEAASAMLTEADRVLGHRLAAAWLERTGELDAMVLAEHYDRGGEPPSAVRWYRRAAEQALEGNDLGAAIARAERGIACGADGDVLGALYKLQAEGYGWRGELAEAERLGDLALKHLPRKSTLWWGALADLSKVSRNAAKSDRVAELGTQLLGALEGVELGPAQLRAAASVVLDLVYVGHHDLADVLVGRILSTKQAAADDPALAGQLDAVQALRALIASDFGTAAEFARKAGENFALAGDRRQACTWRQNLGYLLIELGSYARAEAVLRETLLSAKAMNLGNIVAATKGNLGLALALTGRIDEALVEETQSLALLKEQRDLRLLSGTLSYLAVIHTLRGKLEDAEREARAAIDAAATIAPGLAFALGRLAAVLLAQGKNGEALEVATRAFTTLEQLGGVDEGDALIRLVYAEALHAAGDPRAKDAARAAREHLQVRADKIKDPAWRSSFLGNVPENVRTTELAAKVLGD
jgi:eukaryotic-like serine/threonine-protein kinase